MCVFAYSEVLLQLSQNVACKYEAILEGVKMHSVRTYLLVLLIYR